MQTVDFLRIVFSHFSVALKAKRNIFDFNHIDTTLSKGTIEMLKSLYAYYHKKHQGYEKLYRDFQRKKSVLQYFGRQGNHNFSSCQGYHFEPHFVRFLAWLWPRCKNGGNLQNMTKKLRKPTSPGSSLIIRL